MGKIKNEGSAAPSSTPSPKGGGSKSKAMRSQSFWATLLTGQRYKASQGWYARLWTGIGLGTLVVFGAWRLYIALIGFSTTVRASIAGAVLAGLGWLVYRLVHYPPFAEFLISTQAEMNKVSWISRDDLKRATAVVLVTVLLLSLFLFGIDQVWMRLLASDWIGVLELGGGSAG